MTRLEDTGRPSQKKIIILSANKFGVEILKKCKEVYPEGEYYVITLSERSSTVMYDGVSSDAFRKTCSKVYEVENINNEEERIKKINPDLMVVSGWRQIVKSKIYSIPKLGTIGFHPSPLPKGRGPAPIINSILQGWSKSAVTMFYVDEGLDSGDIIGRENFDILEDDYASDVYDKVTHSGIDLVDKFFTSVLDGSAPRDAQNEDEATFFKKPSIRDNEIDVESETPEKIYRKIRALSYPYLGAFIKIGNKKLVIERAKVCTRIKDR